MFAEKMKKKNLMDLGKDEFNCENKTKSVASDKCVIFSVSLKE